MPGKKGPAGSRYYVYVVCVLLALLGVAWLVSSGGKDVLAWLMTVVFGALAALGTHDVLQTKRAVSRNYPIMAHFRYSLESIRAEIRQYFIEDDYEETPFSRVDRSLIYQRAKDELASKPFGTLRDVYAPGYEWVNHSMAPSDIVDDNFRVTIGHQATQPYSASVFNISAMSFGSLSAHAIEALNHGAKKGSFYHDTGEGGISPYHLKHGGDLVWEIGSGYFGCRDADGFNEAVFAQNAKRDEVKMIEIKLSQGAKPGHGGILPGAKVTEEIAAIRGVPVGQDCISPAGHTQFNTPIGLLEFVQKLRDLSGGKPVGFKLAIGHPWEWLSIAKAMHETQILPDFIVVDGGEGGTGAAPLEFANHVGVPLVEGLVLVHNSLVGLNLRDKIKIGAAGKVVSAFDIARTIALGADWCNAGRGFMFSLGCIQSLSCHTGHCPTGIATQNASRQRALVPDVKADRVHRYHQSTMHALKELLQSAGLTHPSELGPEHIVRRVSDTEVRALNKLYPYLKPGALLDGSYEHSVFEAFWPLADAQSFAVPDVLRKMQRSKSL